MSIQTSNFSWAAFTRATIVASGAAVPLFILYVVIYMYIPANHFNGGLMGQVYEPPSAIGKITSTILAISLLFIDFLIGRRYYLKIQKRAIK